MNIDRMTRAQVEAMMAPDETDQAPTIQRAGDLAPIDFEAYWSEIFESEPDDPLVPPWPLRHLTDAIRFGVLQPHNWTR